MTSLRVSLKLLTFCGGFFVAAAAVINFDE